MPDNHSVDDLVFDINTYRELNAAKDIRDFKQRILNIVNRLGFSDYTYTRLEYANDIEAHLISIPDEIAENYHAERYWEDDVILEHCRSSTAPLRLSVVEDYLACSPVPSAAFGRNCELYRMVASFGYSDFYHIPYKAHNGSGNIMFSVTSKDESSSEIYRKVEKHKTELHLLADAIDFIGTCKFPDYFLHATESRDIQIAPKALRVLTLLANEDLTLKQAADRLSISVDIAQRHVAAARKAFGVSTTNRAVYYALSKGLIAP